MAGIGMNIVSFAGIFWLMAVAWAFSTNRRNVNGKLMFWGVALQLLFAGFSLKDVFPSIAGHLVAASVLCAPASLVMSKLLLPEDGAPKTLGKAIHPFYERPSNVVEAVITGSNDGVKLIVGIVALLLSVLGIVGVVDAALGWLGGHVNHLAGFHGDWSMKALLGYLFYPFTVMMGVPVHDAWAVSRIVGERAVVTEVVAYNDLAAAMRQHLIADPRSVVIAAYALCGFAHVASAAIFIGGTAALAPGQTRVLARLGLRSLFAATLACLMAGCVAGVFYRGPSVLFGAP